MLKGTLDDFTLPDIFRLMSQSRKTGRLDVERSAGRGSVFFRDGNVYFAESTLSRELIGQKLVKAKVLTDGQLMKALDEQADAGGLLGEILKDAGLVGREELEVALRAQIEDAVFDLLRWDAGQFDWAPDEAITAEVSLSVSVENLIMEGSRRLDELAIITRQIPSETSVVEMAPAPPDGAAEINIRPDEWRVLVLVNGQRSVLDIAEAVGSDVFATMRTLYGLAAAGLVHVPGHVVQEPAEPLPAPSEAPGQEAAVSDVDAPEAPRHAEIPSEPEEVPIEQVFGDDDGPAVDTNGYHADAYTPDAAVPDFEIDLPQDNDDDDADRVEEEEAVEAEADAPVEAEVDAPVEATDMPTSEWFDPPDPGDGLEAGPEGSPAEVGGTDPFAGEILAPLDDSEDPDLEPEPHGEPAVEAHTVDKRAAVQELSDLFRQTEVDSNPTFIVPENPRDQAEEEPEAPPAGSRHRVEDDEEITRGLISRLIDGVKGL